MSEFVTFTAEQIEIARDALSETFFHAGFIMDRELGEPVAETPTTPVAFRKRSEARSRSKSQLNGRISSLQERLALYGLGLAGEAGEVADEVKKLIFHDKPLDRDHIIVECGDVLWYLDRLLALLDATIEDAMYANEQKLAARYPDGWDAAEQHFDYGEAGVER